MWPRLLALFISFSLGLGSSPLRAAPMFVAGLLLTSPHIQDMPSSPPNADEPRLEADDPSGGDPQTMSPLDRHSEEIHRKVQRLGISAPITVILKNKREYYGSITRVKADLFEINEVDRKQLMTFQYTEVKKVHEGYGAKNALAGKRVHPNSRLIGLAVVTGLLIALVIAVSQAE